MISAANPQFPGCEAVSDAFVNIAAGLRGGLPYQPWAKDLVTPGLLVIMNEPDSSYRQIFTDGRPLPTDPNPSWNGYSSGRWDGDTLVVHTNGLRDRQWLDALGNPITDAARITERFHRPDLGRLDIEITVDDPRAYTHAWTVTLHQVLTLDTDLLPYVCGENEKDAPRLSSK